MQRSIFRLNFSLMNGVCARASKTLVALLAVFLLVHTASAQRKTISRSELEDLLSHSINAAQLNEYCKTPDGLYPGTDIRVVDEAELRSTDSPGSVADRLKADRESGALFLRYQDMMRLIGNVRPKLITDAVSQWGAWDWNVHLARCRATVRDIKAIDSTIVVQAALNEYADLATTNAIGTIPPWVWAAFGLEDGHRSFDIRRMLFLDWQRSGRDGIPQRWWDYSGLKDGLPAALVPDIRTTEAKMWFYYQARMFIDMGCESVSFSQVELMNNNVQDPTQWMAVFQKLRAYADTRTDIRYLLLTGHTTGMRDIAGNLAFDFHSAPVRPSETGTRVDANGGDCDIIANSCGWGNNAGKLYNRSLGGRAPSGWMCESLPGVVFIDNYGNNGPPENWGKPKGTGTCNLYHFDEITWFASQDEAYRNAWLRYAAGRVRRLDKNLYFALPVKRGPSYRKDWYPSDYLANNPRPGILGTPATTGGAPGGDIDRAAVGLHCGYAQEETIKQILAGDVSYAEARGVELLAGQAGNWLELALGDDVFERPVRYRLRNTGGRGKLKGRFAERSQRIDVSGLPPGRYRGWVESGGKRYDASVDIER